MNTAFIDKVYDTYLRQDYEYGTDNLNPLREISQAVAVSPDDEIARIYAEISKRVDTVKKTLAETTVFAEREIVTQGATSGGYDKSDSQAFLENLMYAGSTNGKIFAVPGMQDDMSVLTSEIESLLLNITIALDAAKGPGEDHYAGFNADPSAFSMDCESIVDPLTGLLFSEEDAIRANEAALDMSMDVDPSIDQSGGQDEGENGGGSGSGSGSGSGGDTRTGSGTNVIQHKALAKILAEQEEKRKAMEDNVVTCMKAELGILKMILNVLRIVMAIKQIICIVLPIVVQLCEIVTLAAGAWLNPAGVAEIVQKISQLVTSILMGALAQGLQMLWDLLGLDCVTTQTQDVINEIKKTLSGVKNIAAQVDSCAVDLMNVKNSYGDATQAWKDAKEKREAALAELQNSWKDSFNGEMSKFQDASHWKDIAKGTLSVGLPLDSIKGIVDSVKEVQSESSDAAKGMDDAFKKLEAVFNAG